MALGEKPHPSSLLGKERGYRALAVSICRSGVACSSRAMNMAPGDRQGRLSYGRNGGQSVLLGGEDLAFFGEGEGVGVAVAVVVVVGVGEADEAGVDGGEGIRVAGFFGFVEGVAADVGEGGAVGADGDGDGFRGSEGGDAEEDGGDVGGLPEVDGDGFGERVGVAAGEAVLGVSFPASVGEAAVVPTVRVGVAGDVGFVEGDVDAAGKVGQPDGAFGRGAGDVIDGGVEVVVGLHEIGDDAVDVG